MARKTIFLRGGLGPANNLVLALGTNLKFYNSVAKGLKLKVRRFWGLIPTCVELTEEKLWGGGGGAFCPHPPTSPILNSVKASAFGSLCLVPNKIDLVFYGRNAHLIYYQQTSHIDLKNRLVVAFQFQLHFSAGKLCKYHLHKVTNHWQQLGASRLHKAKTRMVLEWIFRERHMLGSMGWSNQRWYLF